MEFIAYALLCMPGRCLGKIQMAWPAIYRVIESISDSSAWPHWPLCVTVGAHAWTTHGRTMGNGRVEAEWPETNGYKFVAEHEFWPKFFPFQLGLRAEATAETSTTNRMKSCGPR